MNRSMPRAPRAAFRWLTMSAGCLLLLGCGGGGGGGATAATGAASTATATPAPAPPPPPTYSVNGASVTPAALETITTRSGTWRLSDLGAVGSDMRAYLWQLDGKANFARVMVCRRIFTKEAGDTTDLSVTTVPVRFTIGTSAWNWSLGVAQGACRIAQTEDPVAPNPAWLREAVTQNLIPAYRRERAWLPARVTLLAPDTARGDYDPASLGPVPGSTATPTSASNYVGVTSNQGGEYTSSRSFVHDIDARLVDAALHNEDSRIATVWPQVTQYSFYSLAQPQGGAWSFVNHGTIDPQFPQDGDRAWEAPTGVSPNTAVDSMTSVTNWGRDVPHLENTAYAHWLLTEDPVAGLVVQRQAAYALAAYFENYRGGYKTYAPMTAYAGYTGQERGMFNTMSALWKSLQVSKKVTSANGRVFWSAARAQRQANEALASYDVIAKRIGASTAATPSDYLSRLSGTLFGSAGSEAYEMADGTQTTLMQTSDFMLQQYGKEPLWLWAKAGDARVRGWFETYARSMVLRLTAIGGAMGVDKRSGVRGSGYPIGPTTLSGGKYIVAAAPPFSDDAGWAQWVVSLPLADKASRTTFAGAAVHTAMQSEATLRFAKDLGLPVTGLDDAIAQVARTRAATATSTLVYPDLQMQKHMGSPD
ncbi:MAG: hypothetical protein INF91_04970 [Alphaproteobacteria bacterium]|nr:hypothetical protein [Alphaproteobacteria bacterium]